jgi:hypothetical protein
MVMVIAGGPFLAVLRRPDHGISMPGAVHPTRLDGAKPPTARKAMALAKSKAYQDGAGAEATLRAYATDVANFEAWCTKHGFTAMPATPEVVGAYLAAAGEGDADLAPPGRRHRTRLASPGIRSTPSTRRSVRRSAASVASMAPRRGERRR